MTGVPLNLGSAAALDCNQYSARIRAVVRTRSMNNVLHDLSIIRSEMWTARSVMRQSAKRKRRVAGLRGKWRRTKLVTAKLAKGSTKVAKKDFRLRTRNFLNCALIFFAYFAAFLRGLRG